MEGKLPGRVPAATVLLALCLLLAGKAADAADISGRIGVGITILPICHLITQAPPVEDSHSAPAVNIRCAKGMGYSVAYSPPALRPAGTAVVTTLVTVNF